MTPATKGAEIEAVEETQVPALIAEGDEWAATPDGDMAPETGFGVLSLLPLNRKVDGGFTDPETGETQIRELHFIWLARSKSRAWWPEAFGKGDAAPACRSFDGTKADPSSPQLQNNGDCLTCPHAQWDGDNSPACSESHEAMVFLPSQGSFGRLVRIRFSGLAIGPARAYWRSFAERMPRRPPMAYVTRCELVETTTPNGTFLVPQFSRASDVAFDQAAPLIAERDRRIAEWQESVVSDVVTMRKENGGSGGTGPFDGPAAGEAAETVTLEDGSEF